MAATEADRHTALRLITAHDKARMALLSLVAGLGLPDCWIAAGFVRNAVWDHLHDRPMTPPSGDIDVIWFDPQRASEEADGEIERWLAARAPAQAWSVKNQARMHLRNGDAPYASSEDAMRYWSETVSSVAIRVSNGELETLASHGLADLFGLILRPTPAFAGAKRDTFDKRVAEKRWLERWPRLRLAQANA
ncbi:MAG: nucleotidyltransferase family protein [Tagaea sp.]